MIGVVDLGLGNIGSVRNMLARSGHDVVVGSTADELASSDRLILPGVGAFDRAAEPLDDSGLRRHLDERVLVDQVPVLGICLGMQLLARSSEEGELPGLSWLPADVRRIEVPNDSDLRVPHMGWNTLELLRSSPIVERAPTRFYFVHSYAMHCDDADDVVATTQHGGRVVAAVQRANVFGVQFHPEKSHRFGMELLHRFASADVAMLRGERAC